MGIFIVGVAVGVFLGVFWHAWRTLIWLMRLSQETLDRIKTELSN